MEIYQKAPSGFVPQLDVAGCYIQYQETFLLLRRSAIVVDPNVWCLPGGKVEKNEDFLDAAHREIFEETGLNIDKRCFSHIKTLYIIKPGFSYRFHLFHTDLEKKADVFLSDESDDFKWVDISTALKMPLISGGEKIFQIYANYLKNKLRPKPSVNVYLLLEDNDHTLLLLRKNTGFLDGYYSLIAGHVEMGESALSAIIREAKEEADILIDFSNIECIHVMHRKTERDNIDIFFRCSKWERDVHNSEPDKCEHLRFFPKSSLPTNLVDYVEKAIKMSSDQILYSDIGYPDSSNS